MVASGLVFWVQCCRRYGEIAVMEQEGRSGRAERLARFWRLRRGSGLWLLGVGWHCVQSQKMWGIGWGRRPRLKRKQVLAAQGFGGLGVCQVLPLREHCERE